MGDLEQLLAERIAAGALALAREMAGELNWRGKAFLRVSEAAEVMSVSVPTIARLVDAGTLTARQTSPGGAVLISVASIRRWAGEVE